MKNKLLLVVFFAFAAVKCFSQAYHPFIEPHKYWQVFTADPLPICGFDQAAEYFFDGDTVINGFTYNKLYAFAIISMYSNLPYLFCPPYAVDKSASYLTNNFMREDTAARRVYILDQNGTDQLFMDFSLNVGDTLFSTFNPCYGPPLIVDSVGTYMLNSGASTKIIYLNNYYAFIEGIGANGGLFTPYCNTIGGPYDEIVCVTQNNTQLYNPGIAYGCAGTVGLHELSASTLSITFSNDNQVLSVKSDADRVQLSIYDTNGRKCLVAGASSGENNYSLVSLSPGCYLVRVLNATLQQSKMISILH